MCPEAAMEDGFRDNRQRSEFLLQMMLDENESLDLRNAAATYLGHFDYSHTVQALIAMAANKHEHESLLSSCGVSIAQIWDRNKDFDIQLVLEKIAEPAREEIRGWLQSK